MPRPRDWPLGGLTQKRLSRISGVGGIYGTRWLVYSTFMVLHVHLASRQDHHFPITAKENLLFKAATIVQFFSQPLRFYGSGGSEVFQIPVLGQSRGHHWRHSGISTPCSRGQLALQGSGTRPPSRTELALQALV